MAYIRGNKAELDAWEKLGNLGWNWASLYPYYKQSENFTTPSQGLQAAGVTFDASVHGYSGPVCTGYATAFGNMTLTPTVRNAWEQLGLPHNVDPGGGNIRGVSTSPLTLEPAEPDIRCDAARAYWYPVEGRPNLKIIRGTAQRLVWADTPECQEVKGRKSGGISAKGVEYLAGDGQTAVVSATKEVILSAGSIRSPLVLEGSGIGNPR
jgi:choline dehydrogenase